MEASAFLKLCQHSQHTDVQSLGVIKGVSDLGDQDKGRDPTIYELALENTGEALKDWISYWFRSMTWEPNEGMYGLFSRCQSKLDNCQTGKLALG